MAAAMVAARAAAMSAEAMSAGAMSAAAMSAAAMSAVVAETAAASRGAVAVAAMVAVATAARGRQGGAGVGGLDERGRLPPLPPEGFESNNCVSSSLQKAPIRGVCTAERPRLLHPLFLKHLLAHTHTHGACIHAAKGSLQLVHTRAYMLAGVRGMEPSIPHAAISNVKSAAGNFLTKNAANTPDH